MLLRRLLGLLLVVVIAAGVPAVLDAESASHAETKSKLKWNSRKARLIAWRKQQAALRQRAPQPRTIAVRPQAGTAPPAYTYVSKQAYAKAVKDRDAALKSSAAAARAAHQSFLRCMERVEICRVAEVPAVRMFRVRPLGEPAAPPPPVRLAPEEIAYLAMAELTLTPPRPAIGPPPEINEWKMAAVGYPLWLWVQGNTDPAPVTSSTVGIAVSLDARLQRVVFDMGDGQQVTCTNVTHRWTRAVEPGTKSPACGYRYTRPSLPQGRYRVTARSFWAIDWSVNGVGGTIPMIQSASTTLPVGELQVLVR